MVREDSLLRRSAFLVVHTNYTFDSQRGDDYLRGRCSGFVFSRRRDDFAVWRGGGDFFLLLLRKEVILFFQG